ncbi:MAG: hypothetical protein RLZZ350_272, partial [Verrucomicrobiota bacterium]
MAKTRYLPNDEAGRSTWLNNLSNKLPTYAAALGLTAADTAAMTADAAFFAYILNAHPQVQSFAQQWTTYKITARDGGSPVLGPMPVAPTFGVAPAAVLPGIIGRAQAMVARIKAAPGYADSIGQALQIIGADQVVDLSTMKPGLTTTLDAGAVTIGWAKQGMDSLELWVDRGAGFVFLAIDTVPDYTDTQPLPAAGQSALWKYKGIYRQNDERVG